MDKGAAPDGLVSRSETVSTVRRLVHALPQRQREVIILRIFEELSVRDTAQTMGCREGTVKALLHKATASLRITLNEGGME